jgi:hypothetical protein
MAPQFDRALRELLRGAGWHWSAKDVAAMKSGTAQLRGEILPYLSAYPVGTPPTPSCARPACPKLFDVVASITPGTAAVGW